MAKYMLIESRDPFESNDVAFSHDLATGLANNGHDVTVLLVQNGVLPARRGAAADGIAAMMKAGIKVRADEFSLRERGITHARLVPGVESAALDIVIDHMAAGHKTLWH